MADKMAAARAALAARRAAGTTTAPQSSQSKPRKPRFKLGWWGVAIVVLALLLLLAIALAVVQGNTQAAGAAVGLVPIRSTKRVIVLRPNKAYVTADVLARLYKAADGPFPPLRILDASAPTGGPLAPHKSHQKGVDVDIRTGSEVSLAQLQAMVDSFRAVGAIVASSRPGLTGVVTWEGHMDHTHVRFE